MAHRYGVRPSALIYGLACDLALDIDIYARALKMRRTAFRRALPGKTKGAAQAVHNVLSFLEIYGG